MSDRVPLREDGSDEREFLHDIASPIATASLGVDMVIDTLQNCADTDQILIQQLLLTHQALERVVSMLRERRQILIERGVPSART